MGNKSSFQVNIILVTTYFVLTNLAVFGNPIQIASGFKVENELKNSDTYINMQNSNKLNCSPIVYELENIIFLNTNDIFLKSENITVHLAEYRRKDDKILVCPHFQLISTKDTILNCTHKFTYESDEFQIFPNRSALLHGVIVLPTEYQLKGIELLTCAPDTDDYFDIDNISSGMSLNQVSIYVGQAGSAISIVALIIHLFTFCFLPTLRNLPGYNLASLSVAFLLGYSFVLIGQIPEVLGLFCVISAILQQIFFLAAFFFMNVMAFDVWRTLKLATVKLIVGSQNTRKRQFIWYSLYAWGSPLLITSISVIVDNSDNVPDSIKPYYGRQDTCWLTNNIAKTIFFAAPAFTLFIINGFFFVSSFCMIYSNTMQCTNDQSKTAVKFNYFLYLRLALMMGLTWLVGIIALISKNDIVWFIFDILNSLQGLFLLLLFTCTRKVMKRIRDKTSSTNGSIKKQTTLSSNSTNFNSKN